MSGLTLASPWISGTFPISSSSTTTSLSSSSFEAANFSKHQLCPSSTSPSTSSSYNRRVVCRSQLANNLGFILHDALDSSGIDTTHARAAREGFCSQIKRLSDIEKQTSISINRGVDLGKTALYIAAEDDSLVSHSSVPLPVDAFIDRLDDLCMDYCSHYSSSFRSSPDIFLECLERYLYVNKGFRRNNVRSQAEPRALYLHSVLTHRSGSASMLSLIYSEVLKMLRLCGLLNFDVEIFFPHDLYSLPRGYHKQRSKESDQPHIMTSQSLLLEILRNLKDAFWPFQLDHTSSLFLRAARAANCTDRSNNVEERPCLDWLLKSSFQLFKLKSCFGSVWIGKAEELRSPKRAFRRSCGFELASAKAAQHRLERGVWTSVRFGDMRRALSACERLILLETDFKELRDYGALLYHCGFFEESLQYLKLYLAKKNSSIPEPSSDTLSHLEEDAVEKLIVRLNLILMEEGWTRSSYNKSFLGNYSEPW